MHADDRAASVIPRNVVIIAVVRGARACLSRGQLSSSRTRIGIAISKSRSGILGFDESVVFDLRFPRKGNRGGSADASRGKDRSNEPARFPFAQPVRREWKSKKERERQGIYIWVNWRVAQGSSRPRGALRVIFTGPSCARW